MNGNYRNFIFHGLIEKGVRKLLRSLCRSNWGGGEVYVSVCGEGGRGEEVMRAKIPVDFERKSDILPAL